MRTHYCGELSAALVDRSVTLCGWAHLRREPMQRNLRLRYRVAMAVRDYLDAHGFIDIETPMLTRSTPEGARDYLVPSRVHPGEFYALPQSPQLFKQLLMVAGFDRYYQIVRCFRDEDLRADRQPEFTQIDDYAQFVATYGAKGLAYIKVNPDGLQSPIVKFLPENVLKEIVARTGARAGDFIFFGADKAKVVNDSLGALRVRLGQDKGLVEKGWRALWVVDFPMFEWDEEGKRWSAMHHPFTSPKDGHEERLAADPGKALAKGYDLVLNGWEIGGGSVRIHRAEVQSKVFKALGISEEEAKAKFGFLLENLQYGAPPHGGIAFGLDRLVALMAGAESIRDVIAFPKTQRAQDLLVQAPGPVDEKQLREVGLRLRAQPKASR